MPLAKFFIPTIPRSTEIPASIPIAIDIARSMVINLALLPPNASATATRPDTIRPRTTIPTTPFANSLHFISAINFITTVNISIAAAIANSIVPSFGADFPPSLVIETKARMNTVNTAKPVTPFPNSSHVIPTISLITAVIISNAADI